MIPLSPEIRCPFSIFCVSFDGCFELHSQTRLDVEPDEERLVVGLELDLEQGGVHPQGENVLR